MLFFIFAHSMCTELGFLFGSKRNKKSTKLASHFNMNVKINMIKCRFHCFGMASVVLLFTYGQNTHSAAIGLKTTCNSGSSSSNNKKVLAHYIITL